MKAWATLAAVLALASCEFGMFPPHIIDPRDTAVEMRSMLCGPLDGCIDPPFPDFKDCSATVRPYLDTSMQAAIDADLTFSRSCLEAAKAAAFSDDPMSPNAASGTWLSCDDDCQFFYGDQPEGAPCESYGHRMSDCGPDLVCAPDRTCHAPCDASFVAPQGGYCGPERGMWFVRCDAGLRCTMGTCEPAAAIGAPCSDASACTDEGWCDASSGTCMADLPGGSACEDHSHCASDLCVDGACVEPESLECGRWGW